LSEHDSNRRTLFRLRFPLGEQPCLQTDAEDYTVIELAENSARLEATGKSLSKESATSAILRLKSGTELPTSVKLSRIEDGHLIVELQRPVEQKEIMEEQRRLLAKYGKSVLRDS